MLEMPFHGTLIIASTRNRHQDSMKRHITRGVIILIAISRYNIAILIWEKPCSHHEESWIFMSWGIHRLLPCHASRTSQSIEKNIFISSAHVEIMMQSIGHAGAHSLKSRKLPILINASTEWGRHAVGKSARGGKFARSRSYHSERMRKRRQYWRGRKINDAWNKLSLDSRYSKRYVIDIVRILYLKAWCFYRWLVTFRLKFKAHKRRSRRHRIICSLCANRFYQNKWKQTNIWQQPAYFVQ